MPTSKLCPETGQGQGEEIFALRTVVKLFGLCARVTRTQFTTEDRRVICDLLGWCDFNDLKKVEFGCWVLFTLHDQNVLEALVVRATVQRLAVAHAVEFEVRKCFANGTWVEGAAALNRICIKQRLDVACVRRLAGWEAVLFTKGLNEGFGTLILQRPVPVRGAEDALHVGTRTFRHQTRIERHNDFKVLAVDLLVAQAKLNRVGQRVDHVPTVVVQYQNVGT